MALAMLRISLYPSMAVTHVDFFGEKPPVMAARAELVL
jgi:hypothetical protein